MLCLSSRVKDIRLKFQRIEFKIIKLYKFIIALKTLPGAKPVPLIV